MKNLILVFFSTLISVLVIYLVLFFYTFFNLNKEFVNTFKSIEELNFYWYEDPLVEEDIYNYIKLH